MDVCLEHMDRRRLRPQADAVAAALFDDLGFLQGHLLQGRHDDAVAGGLHLVHRVLDLVVPFPDGGELGHGIHQGGLICNRDAGGLPKDLIEQVGLDADRDGPAAPAQLHRGQPRVIHILAGDDLARHGGNLADLLGVGGGSPDGFDDGLADGMRLGQAGQPFGQLDADFPDRELEEDLFKDPADPHFIQLQAVDRHDRNAVFAFELGAELQGRGGGGIDRIEQEAVF